MGKRKRTNQGLFAVVLAGLLAVSGCSGGNETQHAQADPAPAEENSTPAPEPTTPEPSETPVENPPRDDVEAENADPSPVTEPVEKPEAPVEDPPVPTETETPEPEPEVEPVETPEPPTPEEQPAPDPVKEMPNLDGQVVNVADTKPGLTRVGAAKCKLCHKIQFASWTESAHAKRDPQIDCESCHGSGSEYKKKSVMEDPALAKAAGLVTPEKAYCDNCHLDDWQADYMERSHAHKEDPAG